MRVKFWSVSLLLFALILAACGDTPTAAPAPGAGATAAPPTTALVTVANRLTPLPATVATTTAAAPAPGASANTAKGLSLFVQNCGGCHGGEKATGKVGPALNNISFPFEGLLRQVRSGAGVMPAFPASSLPDADVRLIYDYLQSLKK